MYQGIAEKVIVDSDLTLEEVLRQRQEIPAPQEVLERQRLVQVSYYSFDERLHQGQIVIDENLLEDITDAFNLITQIKFPVHSVIPYIDRKFLPEDKKMESLNNSSGFNYRNIAGTGKLSNHALGRAIDINPLLNPYIRADYKYPEEAKYNPEVPGTIIANDEIVRFFKVRGWIWGGEWEDRRDFMHFEKPIKNKS